MLTRVIAICIHQMSTFVYTKCLHTHLNESTQAHSNILYSNSFVLIKIEWAWLLRIFTWASAEARGSERGWAWASGDDARGVGGREVGRWRRRSARVSVLMAAVRSPCSCDMTHSYVWNDWHDSFICETWLVHMCDMTHSYVWRDAFIRVTRRVHMCDMTHSYVCRDSFICLTWHIHMCAYVWHDSFICEMRPVHVWNVRLSCLHHDKLIRVTWLLICVVRDMTHSYVRCDPFMCEMWLTHVCVSWLIHMCDMTHSYVGCDLFMSEMWLSCLHHDKLICVTWLLICVVRDMTPHMFRSWHDSMCEVMREIWLTHLCDMTDSYGVATISRLLKMIGLFCKRAL